MVEGGLTTIEGVDYYRIDGVEGMEPFLTTVVSESDLWMFMSSTGALTAGRIDADHALFPYLTDDRLHRSAGQAGPVTVVARTFEGRRELWRPFHAELTPGCTRSIAKSVLGDRLIVEERHDGWQLRFRATWAPSTSHGWVRTVELVDDGALGAEFEVLDGLLDVMPAGVDALMEQIRSNLVDAYKRSETGSWGTLAVYTLESLITDQAEPAEALTATTVWSWGFDHADLHLDARAVAAMLDGHPTSPRRLVTGRPGAYLLRGRIRVPVGGRATWAIVADIGLGHPEVLATAHLAGDPEAGKPVIHDIEAGSSALRELLAGADAFQSTGDPVADAHHLSNVLFNSMRGGVFPYGHRVPAADLAVFIATRNPAVANRHREWLDGLDEWVDVASLRAAIVASGDRDLIRLVLEYLPLTFSRRHGDPSRPWNRFSIKVRDDDGGELLSYEGNWRDIFQNWEALLCSFPAYLANVVAKFVNASTIDGHNPYRISRNGVDWEVPDPHDPWANIGYWGDHQIVYLLRLLEEWEAHEPGAVREWLEREVFVYADVPYAIAEHDAMVRDPRNTIAFDRGRAEEIAARQRAIGSDGRLLVGQDGRIVHVGLAEKLLVPALAKLSSYVPGGGIWMNTQRPEWNDANNALAGPGLSMVTLYHLDRYLHFVGDQLDTFLGATIRLTGSVAEWVHSLLAALQQFPVSPVDDRERRAIVDALGTAATEHRGRVRAGGTTSPVEVSISDVRRLIEIGLEHLGATITAARRSDGLYHSYNLVSFPTADTATVDHLGPMLEGQVAVLSSGALGHREALDLLDALFASGMYRPDVDSFMLYPVVERPPFLDRNVVPDSAPWSAADLEGPLRRVFVADGDGRLRFRPYLTNAKALDEVLDSSELDAADRIAVHDVYEQVFHHRSFTGRSGGMYGYEGIGSVYWHMVSKLLLAVQERCWSAADDGVDRAVLSGLREAYGRVRAGLGFMKTPAEFGAFPTDCYSHTPAHAGAQQPGMTGQVKEEVLTRFGELGVRVDDGELVFDTVLLRREELLSEPTRWSFVAADGSAQECELGEGSVGLTVCQVPIVVTLTGGDPHVEIEFADGRTERRPGHRAGRDISQMVFGRTNQVRMIRASL